jgi:hypothetical protein
MPLNLKNLDYFKNLKEWTPEAGVRLAEMMNQVNEGVTNVEQQTNSNAQGQPLPPPPINNLKVTASQGHFSAEINHEGAQFYRSPNYFLVHADNPQFTNPHIVDLGASRNWNGFLGNTNRYFAAYASYQSSPPSPMTYHGGRGQPQIVKGGGSVPGAVFGASQGSGTGTAGVAHSGPGPVPFRTRTGSPPVR